MQLSKSFLEMAERFVGDLHRETGYSTINEIAISKEEELRNPLTKEGFSCAVVIEGAKVGTFGITGKLENVTAIAHLAAMVMAGWVRQLQQQELLHATAERADDEINSVTTKIEAAIANFETVGEAMTQAVLQASSSISSTGEIIDTVEDFADQTYMLGINANIEAGRLGAQGAAFGIVASEMGRLSRNAKQSLQSIQNTMDDIRHAISNVEAASRQSAALFTQSVTTMRAVAPVVQTLVQSVQRLENSFKESIH